MHIKTDYSMWYGKIVYFELNLVELNTQFPFHWKCMHQLFLFSVLTILIRKREIWVRKKMFTRQLKVLHNHHECSIQWRDITSRKHEVKQGLKISKLHKHHIVYRREYNLKTRAYIWPIIGILLNSNLIAPWQKWIKFRLQFVQIK